MSVDPGADGTPLRARVMQRGRVLLVRQVAGLIVTLVGMLALTRIIGPADYGVYTAAFTIAFFAQTMGELSLDVFIVRHPGELSLEVCHQVFTLLLVLAVGTTTLMLAITPLIADIVRLPNFTPVMLVLFASIPIMHMQQVPLSRLERRLDYGSIGPVEVGAQVAFYVVAVPMAVKGAGVWAPVAGWWSEQLVLLLGFWLRDDYRPSLRWRPAEIRQILAFGGASTGSTFVYNLRNLVNPLLVGSTLGAAAVGYVSLSVRLLEQLAFARNIILRMWLAVVARVVEDRERLRRGLESAMEMQIVAVGIPQAGFALTGALVIPRVFGAKWTEMADLVPILMPSSLAFTTFQLVNAVMLTKRRPWELFFSQGASTILLAVGAAVLLPIDGVKGYGYAELIAMASWIVADHFFAKHFLRPKYTVPLCWWLGLSAIGLAPVTSWWLALVAAPCLLSPASVRRFVVVARMVLPRRGGGDPLSEPS